MTSGHEKDPKVMAMVRRQLTRRTSPPNVKALYGRALRINDGIRELSLRQFNALYPLQVRRELKRKERAAATTGEADTEPTGDAGAGPAGDADAGPTYPDRPASPAHEGSGDDPRRSAVRSELFALARTVARARDRPELIDVVLDLDRWVDRIRAAARIEGV